MPQALDRVSHRLIPRRPVSLSQLSAIAKSAVSEREVARLEEKTALVLAARLLAPHPTPEDDPWQLPKTV